MTNKRKISLYAQSALYVIAGVNHFRKPDMYAGIMPHWLPWHFEWVYASGVAEIVLGSLLLFRESRQFAAWGIVLLLIAVFPANIQMAIDYFANNNPAVWIALLRLPLQLLLIRWALVFTGKERTIKDSGA